MHFKTLDSMYSEEQLDKTNAKELEEIRQNSKNEELFTSRIDTAFKLPLAYLACVDGLFGYNLPFIRYVGSIGLVVYDQLKAEFNSEKTDGDYPFIVRTIKHIEIRQQMQTNLIEKGITIENIRISLKKTKDSNRRRSRIEAAHNVLHEIVSQFSTRTLNYHVFPSTPAHFMLIMTPIIADIMKVSPYLEEETNMNCQLTDLFTEYFKIVLLHRFHRIQVLHQNDVDIDLFHHIVTFNMRNLNVHKNIMPKKEVINCNKENSGSFRLRDELEYTKNNITTTYSGEQICIEDYFSLVRYRIESPFANAIDWLNCSKPTQTPTGKAIQAKFNNSIKESQPIKKKIKMDFLC